LIVASVIKVMAASVIKVDKSGMLVLLVCVVG